MERLLKTQQVGKSLEDDIVNCKAWGLAVVITCNYKWWSVTPISNPYPVYRGARGSVVGWGTVLQAGRSPVRVPDEVDFFSLPNPSSHIMALQSTQPLTEMSTRKFPGGKSGGCVGLEILQPSVSRMSENVGASTSHSPKSLQGLYRDGFTFTLPRLQSLQIRGHIYPHYIHIRYAFLCSRLQEWSSRKTSKFWGIRKQKLGKIFLLISSGVPARFSAYGNTTTASGMNLY
jgi:hypothetical protein